MFTTKHTEWKLRTWPVHLLSIGPYGPTLFLNAFECLDRCLESVGCIDLYGATYLKLHC